MSRALAELLLRERILQQAQFDEAAVKFKGNPQPGYIKYFVEKRILSETKLLEYLSKRYHLPSINLSRFEIENRVILMVPPELAKKTGVIPIQAKQGTLVVATYDPTVIPKLEEIRFHTKLNVEPVLTTLSAYEAAMTKHYGSVNLTAAVESFQVERQKEQKSESTKAGKKFDAETGTTALELVQIHDIEHQSPGIDAPVVTFVNGILSEGIRRGASDIHVEPYEKRFRVRMRVDGVLLEVAQAPIEMKRAVVARLKIMSRMDIAESRVPQDGRIKLKYGGQEIDFRVNALPTLFGEKVVLRMLSQGNLQLDLKKLGFETQQLEVFKKGIYMPNGMVLVTGPTGSGKTTTLYSALAELNQVTDNISTAEDPVEYNLDGINQVQVNKEVGLTFAAVLRALLRQDPDSILVGEIRDFETAEVAVQAALTGHLVLSTLHTNDAPSTITRLMNMGLEPFLVTASLNTIVAQRLLRTVCSKCKIENPIPRERLIAMGATEEQAARMRPVIGKGCSSCGGTGYRGRVAIYEVLDFSQTLKEMVLASATAIEIRRQAMREGMKTLRQAALTKVEEGRTSLEEAVSLTMES
jgi:type IV pilus assembly protein PilB